MNIDHPLWHQWMAKALRELGDDYVYGKLHEKMQEYYAVHHMKKFLKVGEYNKEGEVK